MNIFLCCSKHFYNKIPPIKAGLEKRGHLVTLPNSYDNPAKEAEMKSVGYKEHATWKAGMLREQVKKVAANDAVLVLNFEKDGQANYIGGATFLEMYKAFELEKKIFLYHPAPDGMLKDEILGFEPLVINEDLSLIK